MKPSITYRVETGDCWDGIVSVHTEQRGYHFETRALAQKIADRIDANECGMTVVVECGAPAVEPAPEPHDSHVWKWQNLCGFDDIVF